MKSLPVWLATRKRTRPVTTLVLHASAGSSVNGSISWLRKIGLSYHYIIDRDGTVTKLAPADRVAFHAGRSEGPDGSNVNEYSIGVCFANRNDGEPYTNEQIEAAQRLFKKLNSVYRFRYLTTHKAISPGRKTDPHLFPIRTFYLSLNAPGLGLWLR